LGASFFRYVTFTKSYGGIGDAAVYDSYGRKFADAWNGVGTAPTLVNIRQTNFMRWMTGIIYFNFGKSLLGAFVLLALLAVVGSYFWYRGLADSVPFVNKRLYLIFMMFAPSIVFWPSSLGKEALMQLGVGAAAWATGLVLTGRFLRAVPLMLGGGWLIWIVRPHLLALVTVGAAIPYFVGRVRRGDKRLSTFMHRPIGMVIVGLLVVFTVTLGANFLGFQKISLEAVQEQLDENTARTSYGGSTFSHGSNSLSPLALPLGLVTVLFRPFPWETTSAFQLLASLESAALIILIVWRFSSITAAIQRCRRYPFLLYCMVLLVFYGMTFSSFANFGLLNRERSLVLPALYALIAVDPRIVRNGHGHDADELAEVRH
jgi:hypothetical protein